MVAAECFSEPVSSYDTNVRTL